MNKNQLLPSEAMGLPENILKHKWAGYFDDAIRAIDARLQMDIAPMLRDRLLIEREIIKRLPAQYPYTKSEAIDAVRAKVPDFTEAEFDRILAEGGVDFLYINGEIRFFESTPAGVLNWDKTLLPRCAKKMDISRPMLDAAIATMKQKGEMKLRLHLDVEYRIEDDAFIPGETYKLHMPVPKPSAQQSNIEIAADGIIGCENQPQRTVYFEKKMDENAPFKVSFSYDNHVKYIDPMARPDMGILYPNVPAPTADDLKELQPHIAFTPYLRHLAAQIKGDKTDNIDIARAVYEYVTKNVTYSFLRDYVLMDNMSEYMALGLRGDCGAQAILFIALCRLNGVPARWQSGLSARPDSLGPHDWAQFYCEEYGWLFVDVSFGGTAWRTEQIERWNFYFGNLDPYRMVANDQYMAALQPEPTGLRMDPFDNQSGECEVNGRMLLTDERAVRRTLRVDEGN